MLLDIDYPMTAIGLEPMPIQVLGDLSKLDDEIARQILWLGLTALLTPELKQSSVIIPHDDPGVAAAYEAIAVVRK
jgi:hypothetical protein